jgi:hypothetical protein
MTKMHQPESRTPYNNRLRHHALEIVNPATSAEEVPKAVAAFNEALDTARKDTIANQEAPYETALEILMRETVHQERKVIIDPLIANLRNAIDERNMRKGMEHIYSLSLTPTTRLETSQTNTMVLGLNVIIDKLTAKIVHLQPDEKLFYHPDFLDKLKKKAADVYTILSFKTNEKPEIDQILRTLQTVIEKCNERQNQLSQLQSEPATVLDQKFDNLRGMIAAWTANIEAFKNQQCKDNILSAITNLEKEAAFSSSDARALQEEILEQMEKNHLGSTIVQAFYGSVAKKLNHIAAQAICAETAEKLAEHIKIPAHKTDHHTLGKTIKTELAAMLKSGGLKSSPLNKEELSPAYAERTGNALNNVLIELEGIQDKDIEGARTYLKLFTHKYLPAYSSYNTESAALQRQVGGVHSAGSIRTR